MVAFAQHEIGVINNSFRQGLSARHQTPTESEATLNIVLQPSGEETMYFLMGDPDALNMQNPNHEPGVTMLRGSRQLLGLAFDNKNAWGRGRPPEVEPPGYGRLTLPRRRIAVMLGRNAFALDQEQYSEALGDTLAVMAQRTYDSVVAIEPGPVEGDIKQAYGRGGFFYVGEGNPRSGARDARPRVWYVRNPS